MVLLDMALFQSTKDYVFSFSLYVLFVTWNIYDALQSHFSIHKTSPLVTCLGAGVIAYVLIALLPFFRRAYSRLEKAILGLTVGLCFLELVRILPQVGFQPPLAKYFRYTVVLINCVALFLAAIRLGQVLVSRRNSPK
jgi:hypothetical protein